MADLFFLLLQGVTSFGSGPVGMIIGGLLGVAAGLFIVAARLSLGASLVGLAFAAIGSLMVWGGVVIRRANLNQPPPRTTPSPPDDWTAPSAESVARVVRGD